MPKNDFTEPKAHALASKLLLRILFWRFKTYDSLCFDWQVAVDLMTALPVLQFPDLLISHITLVVFDDLLRCSFAFSLD